MKNISLKLILIFSFFCSQASAQCGPFGSADCGNCASISSFTDEGCATAPYTFDASSYITLPPGYTPYSYSWSSGDVTPTSGMGLPSMTTIIPTITGSTTGCGSTLYSYDLSVMAIGPNQISNGDFSSGATDFCSALTLSSPPALSAGNFTVCNDAGTTTWFIHPPTNFYDNDVLHNNMFIFFGTAPNLPVWWQEVNICPEERYFFSFAQAALRTTASPSSFIPVLQVEITDADGVHTFGPYAATGLNSWQTFQLAYTPSATAGSTARIAIVTTNKGLNGPSGKYLVALDDITFNRLCQVTANLANINEYYSVLTGPSTVCPGSSITLTGCFPTGSWSTSDATIATVSSSGVVTGITPGTATITFVDGLGCPATMTVTVLAYPDITGSLAVCPGSTVTWTSASGTGTWSSSGNVGTITTGSSLTGAFTGISAGSGYITFTADANGCTVVAGPVTVITPPVISGPTEVCQRSWFTFSSASGPGTWSSSGSVYTSTVGSSTTGSFYPYGYGTAVVYFTDDATTCATSKTITIDPVPDVPGTTFLCKGTPITFTSSFTGGTWTSSTPAVATIDPVTGVITTGSSGMTTGMAVITYTLPTGCYSVSYMFVYDCDGGEGLLGHNVCDSSSTTFILATGIPSGGVWSCSPASTEYSIDPATGLFTCATSYGGPITITYTYGTSTWTTVIYVTLPTTACVTVTSTDNCVFTSPCSSATIYYELLDYYGLPVYYGFTTPGTTMSYIALGIAHPGRYYIHVYGVECNGCWWPVDCTVGKDDFGHYVKPGRNDVSSADGNKLSIFPSPNNGTFVVNGNLETNKNGATFEVINMLGQVVYSEKIVAEGAFSHSITLGNNCANGMYIARLTGDGVNQVVRFDLRR